jgi:hypothetical protein
MAELLFETQSSPLGRKNKAFLHFSFFFSSFLSIAHNIKMDPKDFPSLQPNESTRQDDNRLDASWAKVAKESSNSACGHGDNVNLKKKGGHAKQNKGRLLNKDAPGKEKEEK